MASGVAKFFLTVVVFALSPAVGYCSDFSERISLQHKIFWMYSNQEFAELDALAANYLQTQSRMPSGTWKLTQLYVGVASAHKGGAALDNQLWSRVETLSARWLELYPQSAPAHLANAEILLSRAWSYRGEEYAQNVPEERWRPFRVYVQRTREYLEKHKLVASRDPHWYDLMIQIAQLQKWPDAEVRTLLNEGLDRYPDFYQIYFSATTSLLPKWGGSPAAIEKFAKDSMQRTKAKEGLGMYARIYWHASQMQFGDRLFKDSRVNWPTMKAGFEDVLKNYPDTWNLEHFTQFACMAGDKAKTAELMRRIKQPELDVWGDRMRYDDCKAWALGK